MALNPLLHYDALLQFNRVHYKDLLVATQVADGELLFRSLHDSDGAELEGVVIPAFPLLKDGVKYILPSKVKDGEGGFRQINLREDLPIKVTRAVKIFSKGIGYRHIKDHVTARFRPEKKMTFKELVNFLSDSLPHSNPDHHKLGWFISMASMMYRFNCRVCSPPAFGKDSRVEVMGNLLGNANTIVNPTLAKLELLSISSEWLAINEVVDMTKTDWRIAEQYLLNCGDFTPTVTKRSRSYGSVGETLPVDKLSISLFYNDVDCYPDDSKFFDSVAKSAVKDRFVPFRLHGHFTAQFEEISKINIPKFVEEHYEDYDKILRTFLYYKNNLDSELKYFIRPELSQFSERWKTNLNRLFNIIDLYCKDQEEFNYYSEVVLESIKDYFAMDEYTRLFIKASKIRGEGVVKKLHEKVLIKKATFIEKNEILKQFIKGSAVMEAKGIDKW